MKRAVLTDFDGTVSRTDVAEDLLDAFAPPTWRDIEEEHRARKIGTRETIIRQFALVHASREEMLKFVDERVEPDPAFPAFVAYCRRRDVPLEIVSEGLDFYLEHLLKKWGISVPVRTNHASFQEREIRMSYPYADPTCDLCGTCKLRRVFDFRVQGYQVIYVGDGHSDLCPAIEADVLFAKKELAELCREERLDFIPFDTFSDVQREMDRWP